MKISMFKTVTKGFKWEENNPQNANNDIQVFYSENDHIVGWMPDIECLDSSLVNLR